MAKPLMKKISLLIVLSFCICLSWSQQGQFGIKGGLNVSNITNDKSGNLSSLTGFHIGGLAHIHLTPEWAIQPEVVYSSQGGKYTDNSSAEHKLIVNYLNIPVLFQYMFEGGFRLQTGPQLGFLTNAKDEVGSYNTGYATSSDFKNYDFSWAFGLGYQSPSGLGVDARYNLGISNINNVGTATLHNRVFQIGLFYLFSGDRPYSRRTYSTHRRH
ncbi:MAG: porin family protein [Flavisolibacter sp.]